MLNAPTTATRDLTKLTDDAAAPVRGDDVAMIFQDPMTSLNPVYKIGDQVSEPLRRPPRQTRRRPGQGVELLRRVGIANPEARVNEYPHEFSGGMRQRAMIAMAIANNAADPDRRRADDGARRHHPGPDPRADAGDAARLRLGHHPDHPRPRCDRRHGRPGACDVRRPGGRDGHRRRDLLQPAAPLHVGPAGLGCRGSIARRRRAAERRSPVAPEPAQHGRPAVPVRQPLQFVHDAVPRRASRQYEA